MYHILYVDDEPDLLDIGKQFLERDGSFAVTISLSAIEALDHLESTEYDAIVADYQMPKMDGITFLKTFRATGNTTPFIIFTGRGREEVVIEAFNNGADFYIQKGGDPQAQFVELVHKINHAISRRKADEALKRSENNYRHLIDHANEAIFVMQDGYIRMVNSRCSEISGYPNEEILNQSFISFVHPDDRDMLLDSYEKWIHGEGTSSRYAFRLSCKDGTIRWVELSVAAITWDGRIAALNFLTDITPRKLAEDALRESEERYRQFFRTTRDSVFISTPEGQWIDFNDALVEMFGCRSREEVFNMPVPSIYAHPEDRAVFLDLIEQNGYIKEHPVLLKRRNGETFEALITVAVRKHDDTIREFIGSVRDLTAIKAQKQAGKALDN